MMEQTGLMLREVQFNYCRETEDDANKTRNK